MGTTKKARIKCPQCHGGRTVSVEGIVYELTCGVCDIDGKVTSEEYFTFKKNMNDLMHALKTDEALRDAVVYEEEKK